MFSNLFQSGLTRMQAFRGYTLAQTRGEKKEEEKGGHSRNLGIWVIKKMTFACFILS
jgi:hypothetical protein